MPLTETETCMRLITPALEAAGWDIQTQIRREYTFTDGRLTVRGRISHRGTPSRADYVLFRGDIALAVVEAKKARPWTRLRHPAGGVVFFKAGEAIRTPDIHVGNVQAHRRGGINRVDFLR